MDFAQTDVPCLCTDKGMPAFSGECTILPCQYRPFLAGKRVPRISRHNDDSTRNIMTQIYFVLKP
jgi:hypothetical protein